MNKEEIDYWLKIFYNERHGFKSRDDKVISLYKVFEELKELHNKIDKAIKLIEDDYYSKNTTDIDSIVVSSNKLIQIREILKDSDVDE